MTQTPFAEIDENLILDQCDKYFRTTIEGGINKEQYLLIKEQLGEEVDPEEVPLDLDDLPNVAHVALKVFNLLEDTYVSLGMDGSRYIGKNFHNFELLCKLYYVTDISEMRICLELVKMIEKYTVKQKRPKR